MYENIKVNINKDCYLTVYRRYNTGEIYEIEIEKGKEVIVLDSRGAREIAGIIIGALDAQERV